MTNQLTERTLNKVDVAKTQLDAAIQAYGRGEDVIAVLYYDPNLSDDTVTKFTHW